MDQITTLMAEKITRKRLEDKPLWLRKLLLWMVQIERSDYSWSLQGYSKMGLSAASLFAKLATIFKSYYQFDIPKILSKINGYKLRDGTYEDVKDKKLSETRQAMAGVLNISSSSSDLQKNPYDSLWFMEKEKWKNPWAAGAELSHYIFFCNQLGDSRAIDSVLETLEEYRKPNGWYYGSPRSHWIINGIMKVLTGFDVIDRKMEENMAKTTIDYALDIAEAQGGCGIYDYVYVLVKAMESTSDYRFEECLSRLRQMYEKILEHQMEDGGFKYRIDSDKNYKYYGQEITPDGMIGTIHATTVFCMALCYLDRYLGLGLRLDLPLS